MHFWLDSSAIAKRYIPEGGSAEVRSLFDQPESVVHIGQLVRTEMASALARRVRDGFLTRPEAQAAMRAYFAHQGRQYTVIGIDDRIQSEAERLVFDHRLRAADALHVAGALGVGRHVELAGSQLEFVTADRRQAEAARAEGLDVRLVG